MGVYTEDLRDGRWEYVREVVGKVVEKKNTVVPLKVEVTTGTSFISYLHHDDLKFKRRVKSRNVFIVLCSFRRLLGLSICLRKVSYWVHKLE